MQETVLPSGHVLGTARLHVREASDFGGVLGLCGFKSSGAPSQHLSPHVSKGPDGTVVPLSELGPAVAIAGMVVASIPESRRVATVAI